MNTLIVLAVAIAAAVAGPIGGSVVSVQQDTLGNYDIKYAVNHVNGISRVEQRSLLNTPFISEVVPVPVAASAPVFPLEPFARTLAIRPRHVVVGIAPESPEVLELESQHFAAHVAARHLL